LYQILKKTKTGISAGLLSTGKNCQIVMMRLKPMEDIGRETHENVDQFFRFKEGQSMGVPGPDWGRGMQVS
jgi:mannose-6-phosphate isomerase-like protein (cupin superfamily)